MMRGLGIGLGLLGVVLLGWHYLGDGVTDSAESTPGASGKLSSPMTIAASDQRPGDPVRGREQLLAGDYVSCGIPARVFEQAYPVPEALKLAERSTQDRDLPYFSNRVVDRNNVELITSNCLTCHAAPLFGEITVGLGNEFLDFTRSDNVIDRAGVLVRGSAETAAWEKLARRMDVLSPYTRAATVGVNVANNLTFALMAHMDPVTLEWSDQPLLEPPAVEPLPVSVPPWWRMQKKNALFYQGQGRGDHARIMILAALLCADGVEEVERADAYAPDIAAYIASLEPPDYPFAIDPELVEQGQTVFVQTCSRCHGTYGESGSYPNLLVPLDVVGTDAALALQTLEYERFDQWFARSWYANDTLTVLSEGYMAPPLDGVWATGPFLHNGSVPTIELVLNSPLRPAQWRHTAEQTYDQQQLGWHWESADKNPTDRHVYDTTRYGYGNAGHQFGDDLSAADRAAVIEYLKTL